MIKFIKILLYNEPFLIQTYNKIIIPIYNIDYNKESNYTYTQILNYISNNDFIAVYVE